MTTGPRSVRSAGALLSRPAPLRAAPKLRPGATPMRRTAEAPLRIAAGPAASLGAYGIRAAAARPNARFGDTVPARPAVPGFFAAFFAFGGALSMRRRSRADDAAAGP